MKIKMSIKVWFISACLLLPVMATAADPVSVNNNKTHNAGSANNAKVYRNVNEDGVVEFSDQGLSNINAKPIKIKPTNTFKSADKKPTPANISSDTEANPSFQQETKYTQVSISSPTAEQAIRSNDGFLTVTVVVEPGLNVAAGDQIELYYDGKPQGKQQNTVFNLSDVFRGQHRVQAKIIDKNGALLKISKPIQFYIQKYSSLLKQYKNPKLAVKPRLPNVPAVLP